MSDREQLIQELSQAPDDLVQQARISPLGEGDSDYPVAKFAGILSDSEAEELQESIREKCRQVNLNK